MPTDITPTYQTTRDLLIAWDLTTAAINQMSEADLQSLAEELAEADADTRTERQALSIARSSVREALALYRL